MEYTENASMVADDSGAIMAEYGLLLLFIAMVCLGAVIILGLHVTGLYDAAVAAFA